MRVCAIEGKTAVVVVASYRSVLRKPVSFKALVAFTFDLTLCALIFQGGMRAVIWTDVFQSFVMVIGLVVMVSIGTTEVGGLGNVINIVKKGQRSTLFE